MEGQKERQGGKLTGCHNSPGNKARTTTAEEQGRRGRVQERFRSGLSRFHESGREWKGLRGQKTGFWLAPQLRGGAEEMTVKMASSVWTCRRAFEL